MVRIQLFGCWKPLRRYKMRNKKPRHSSIWCTVTLTIDHNHLHTQTLSHVFTCYELECTVVSRWISSDSFLDAVGCQVKQIHVIFHTKTFLEAIFETDITCNPIYTKTSLMMYFFLDCFVIKLREWSVYTLTLAGQTNSGLWNSTVFLLFMNKQ